MINFVFGSTPYTPPGHNNVVFVFGDTGTGGNVYSVELSDGYGYNGDLITGITTAITVLSDSFAFNDTLPAAINYINTILNDSFGFQDRLTSKDFVVCWSCRTKNTSMGIGDNLFGEVGFGAGVTTDIIKYIIVVKNQAGTVVRQDEIIITDIENPSVVYFYPMSSNISDNGSWQQHMTFEVCQVTKDEILSEFKTVTT